MADPPPIRPATPAGAAVTTAAAATTPVPVVVPTARGTDGPIELAARPGESRPPDADAHRHDHGQAFEPGLDADASISDDRPVDDAHPAVARIEGVLEVVAAEAAVLLDGDAAARDRLADLNLRTALASWDALGRPEEAARLLELADGHPLAARLRLQAAIATGELAELERGAPARAKPPADRGREPRRRRARGRGGRGGWLWRHGDATRAAVLAERVLARPDRSNAARDVAVELAVAAHAAAGAWDRVVALRRRGFDATAPLHRVASTAALLLDRAGDAAAALEVCAAAVERADAATNEPHQPGDALARLRVLDVGIEAAMRGANKQDARRARLLERRAELVASLPGGALDALASRHAHAAELARSGEPAAAARFTALADEPANQLGRAASRIALVAAAHAAAGPPSHRVALALHRRLADSECVEVAATHAWRALELAAVVGEPTRDLARALTDVADAAALPPELVALELAALGPGRHRAARRPRQRDAARGRAGRGAARRARRGARAVARCARRPRPRAAARARRGPAELVELSRLAAEREPDGRAGAALWCAYGIAALANDAGADVAEPALRRAAMLDPADPCSRAALVAVLRARWRASNPPADAADYTPEQLAAGHALATALADLAAALTARDARGVALRQRAELLAELGDATAVRELLERAVAERPDDDGALLALADAAERVDEWDRAVELRLRAVNITAPHRRAGVWLAIAIAQDHRGDRDAALAALDRAADLVAGDDPSKSDPGATSVPADHSTALAIQREQIRVLRATGRDERALAVVRSALAVDPPPARRAELQRELAHILTKLDREPEAVVAAYLDILGSEPDQTDALAGIEAPARALGMWDELARAFRGAPQVGRNLDVLAEALVHVGEWAELAEVRRRQLEQAATAIDRARFAGELAVLYARELGDADAALRMLALAQSLDADPARWRALARLLRDGERWAELATAIERELAVVAVSDIDRQIELLHELGELLAGRLARPVDAVVAYEAVLARRPDDVVAAAALEPLYALLGREEELAGILEARAEATQDGLARAALYTKVAGMRTRRGEIDPAISAYGAAFRANPDSRELFTAMERVCYKAERWAEAMDLYAIAIAHVEAGGSRAYRLGDLYARRANVQRQFLGDVDAAILSYQRVVEVDSQPTSAARSLDEICALRADWLPLIVAWERRADGQRDVQRRTDALRTALQVVGEHATGDVKLGVRLQRKLLALDPGDAELAVSLERYYETHADPSSLIDVLRARLATAITPDDTVALLKKIARTSEEGGRDVVTATEHYRKILDIQRDNRDALDALARIYESTEQWAEYVEITRDLIKVTTDRTTKALLFFRCGSVMEAKFSREHDAIRYYHHAIKTSTSCMPAVHGLRDLYRRREDWHRVIETLELEVKLWTDDKERAGVLAQIGRIHDKQLADPARALELYRAALAADPECLPANQAMFDVHFEHGEYASALALGRALARPMEREGDPATRSEFFRRLGVAAARSGEHRYAADCLRAALEQRPTNTAALDELGAIARAQPDAYDFATIYQALEKDYRKRDDSNPLLARVLVARAANAERDGDLDQAAALYTSAIELAPADLGVLVARLDFDHMTRAWASAIAAVERFVATPETAIADRVVARLRQAQVHADSELDAAHAIVALEDVIRMDPAHHDAHYLLAQELVLAGRPDDARAAIERAIELAGAPGEPLSPEALARYYYYKGHVLDRLGDARAATQYRRAIDHDPSYAPPAVALAQRAAATGDVRGAEALLIETAHAAIAAGGPRAAVPLQRGLARILVGCGERAAAIEAYRGILAVDPDGIADRLALADIYASDDRARAVTELRRVIDRDVRQPVALRALAELYAAAGAHVRAMRALVALELLGYASDADRAALAAERTASVNRPTIAARVLDADVRARLVVAPAAHDALGEVFAAVAEDITATVAAPPLGEALQPLATVAPRAAQIAAEVTAIMQCDAEMFVGDRVPGMAVATAFPRRVLVLDRALLAPTNDGGVDELALRFTLGYHLDAVRGGYACLLALGARQRRDLIQLLRGLVGPATERSGPAAELVERAAPRARKVIDRLANTHEPDAAAWLDGMLGTARRAGLVASDDLAAAMRALVALSGDQLPSADLVRYYVGDAYAQLSDLLVS